MPCSVIKLPGGGTAIVKHAAQRPRACSVCKRKTPDFKLCDFPVGSGKTCSAALCKACARHEDPDTDYCPLHDDYRKGRLKP